MDQTRQLSYDRRLFRRTALIQSACNQKDFAGSAFFCNGSQDRSRGELQRSLLRPDY